MKKELLIIFYRNPLLGKVKTRLAVTLGKEEALAIYLYMAAHTRHITEHLHFKKVVFYSEFVDRTDHWDDKIFQKEPQQGPNLGVRMKNAFQWAFGEGYQSVCIIGTDCLELNSPIIIDAFAHLEVNNVVIGPARDGGFYLLGMNALHERLFMNKDWGTHTVLSDTLDDLQELQLSYERLPILTDIDEESDLPKRFKL